MILFTIIGWAICLLFCLWVSTATYLSLVITENKIDTIILLVISLVSWWALFYFSPFIVSVGG